jgi:hypothetical protein
MNTSTRYIDNIHKTKTYQGDAERFRESRGEENIRKTYRDKVSRQYSQSTYMGMSNG